MSRILIDTNVIIDVLARREPFYQDSARVFSLADMGELELVISARSIANAYYILHDVLKIREARSIIGMFKVLVEAWPLNDKILDLSLNDLTFKDFEDGIQYYTAMDSNCQLIITRNIRDFKNSTIPVMQPAEFLSSHQTQK